MTSIEVDVRPRSPLRLPRLTGGDRLLRRQGRGLLRLLVSEGAAVVVSVRPGTDRALRFSAEGLTPDQVSGSGRERLEAPADEHLEAAVASMRFALGVDDDLRPFREAFVDDPLLGPVIASGLEHRPQRRPEPWEALAWAVTEQLIDYRRATSIQRGMIRRWGFAFDPGNGERPLRTAPAPREIAGAAPAELEACGLSARRSIALIKVAREIDRGRVDPGRGDGDRRLLSIPEIGPWTVSCLALRGRGDPDALPAGDLGHVKLVAAQTGLGRLAETEEVLRFYEPYAPFRGLAGEYLLAANHAKLKGPGSRARIHRRDGLRKAA